MIGPTTQTRRWPKVLGGKTAKALAKALDLQTVGDLLYHFPRRYDERGEHTDMRALSVGEQVTVLAQVQQRDRAPDAAAPRLDARGGGRATAPAAR